MFEQSYQNRAEAPKVREGDFLYNYEIRSWELTPRIYKILGVSLAANVLALAIFGQASFLTAKGCDSPLVGRVCQVLDVVYVGSMLFGTEREYADVAYDATRLSPDDEVTFVDVSNLEAKLDYPDSFIDRVTGQTVPMLGQPAVVSSFEQGFLAPGIPANPIPSMPSAPNLIDTPQVLPKANNQAVIGDLPTFDNPAGSPKKSRIRNRPGNDSVASTDSNANTTVNPTTDPNSANANTAPVDESTQDRYGVFINKRPLKDRAKETIEQVDSQKVKLDSVFKVVIQGTLGLGKDGKTVILKNPKTLPVDKSIPNDPAMVKLVQDWIIAVGDAGWLAYVDRLDDKKVKSRKIVISIEQTDANLIASVQSEWATEEEAKTKASTLALGLNGYSLLATGDEQIFLKSASTTSDGRNMILNFTMPKPLVQEMIQRKLAESKEPAGQPNSTAIASPSNSSAAK